LGEIERVFLLRNTEDWLRTRSKNTFFIWAQLASYLAFYLLLMLVCLFGAKGLASNCAEIDACLFK
jgi:hypothetical protein